MTNYVWVKILFVIFFRNFFFEQAAAKLERQIRDLPKPRSLAAKHHLAQKILLVRQNFAKHYPCKNIFMHMS